MQSYLTQITNEALSEAKQSQKINDLLMFDFKRKVRELLAAHSLPPCAENTPKEGEETPSVQSQVEVALGEYDQISAEIQADLTGQIKQLQARLPEYEKEIEANQHDIKKNALTAVARNNLLGHQEAIQELQRSLEAKRTFDLRLTRDLQEQINRNIHALQREDWRYTRLTTPIGLDEFQLRSTFGQLAQTPQK